MSLPVGILNRPPMVAPHPRVVGRVFQRFARILILAFPLLLHVSGQVTGVSWRRECAQLENAIAQEKLTRRTLMAQRDQLLAPERLRSEAQRLALLAPGPAQRPVVLQPLQLAERRR